MKLPWFIMLLIAVALLSSCQMQKLTVQVYSPSKIELPPDVRGILVTSRFVPATGEYDAVQWGYYESVDSVKWDLSIYYAESFSKILDSTERYISRTDFNQRMLRNNNDSLPEQLPWTGLNKISDQHRASGLAILQGFDINESEIELTENNFESPGFSATRNIIVKSAWRISQPERRRILDESIYTFKKEFKASGSTREETIAALPDILAMKRQACYWAAKEYAEMIIPGFEIAERDYYKEGDIKMEEAHAAMQEKNWSKAEAKWNYLAYQSTNEVIKAKANYNMALICERDGRLNQALGFARKANKYWPHKRHLKLINELTIKTFEEEEKRKRKEVIRNW